MKSTLVLLSLLVIGLRAAPRKGIAPRVINGTPSDPVAPVQHAVAVFAVIIDPDVGFFGGGSIISDRHIITGANLVQGAIRCRIGYGNTVLQSTTRVETSTIVSHSAFNATTLDNDIAIIFLPTRITFTELVRAIALPSSAPPGAGTVGSLAGFGFTSANADAFSENLMIANLEVAANTVCSDRFGEQIPFTNHFCAIGGPASIPTLRSNICSGDNGAGFYTGDGFIPTTTTTTTTTTVEPETTEAETVFDVDEYDENNSNEDEILEDDDEDETQVEPVEPTLHGIASVIGNFWECNPEDPRAYTIVFNYIDWIQILTGIEIP